MPDGADVQAEVRAAEAADAGPVADIWCSGWREAHLGNVPDALAAARPQGSFAARAADRVPDTIVARVGGEVARFVMVLADEVDQLYVAAAHRGNGVAASLLARAEQRIASGGHARAWLAVVPANVRARRFYEREGWRDDGLFEHAAPGPDGPVPVPCHRYVKDLVRPPAST